MDRIRTLLLARTHVVVMDPDLVASAATRPTRDRDVEKFEDDLAQLGYVMSLDLATMVRRLPHQTMQEMRGWIYDTLAQQLGAHRPHVPLFRAFPDGVLADSQAQYGKRMLSWLLTKPEQPCPWCSQVKPVGALDPCGHLVCRECWAGASFAGCP
ncbi:MAG TPA: RING finger family 4 domain-containing protein, partial [Kofleriaceae bacterium]